MTDWLNLISPCLRPTPHGVGHAECKQGWVEPMRVIYDHELVVFAEGECIMEVAGRKFPCPKDTFIIVPPEQPHLSQAISSQPAHRYWAHFNWKYQGEYSNVPLCTYLPGSPHKELYKLSPRFVPQKIFHGPISSPSIIKELMIRLCECWKDDSTLKKLTCRALILEILIELLGTGREEFADRGQGAHLASKTRILLNKLADRPLCDMESIQSSLKRLGYSYAHLCRLFKQHYGISPLGCINALRIARARNLLRDTDLTISQISYQMGFNSLGYFSRFFHKHTGTGPKEFRSRS